MKHSFLTFVLAYLLTSAGQLVAAESGYDVLSNDLEEESLTTETRTFIEIFSCVMPLPPGYVLRADNVSAGKLHFYRPLRPHLPVGGGILKIEPHVSVDVERFEVISEKSVDHLTLVRLKGMKEFFRNSPTLTLIHDGRTRLVIGGLDQNWAERMAEYCTDHMIRS